MKTRDSGSTPSPVYPQADGWLLVRVIAPFLAVILVLVGLSVTSVLVLSTVRAFVAGESLWSKARSEAVAHLRLYAATADEAQYHTFQAALSVPMGDRQAREELDRPDGREELIWQGFVAGGNHAQDIPWMVRLYRCCIRMSFMQVPLQAWQHGDEQIAQLRGLAQLLHAQTVAGASVAAERSALLQRIDALNTDLIATEKRFSSGLGEVSRSARQVLIVLTLLIALGLSVMGLMLVRRLLHEEVRYRQDLLLANRRWRLAADAAGLGLFDCDPATETVELDPQAAELHGLDTACRQRVSRGLLGRHIHEADRADVERAYRHMLTSDQAQTVRYRVGLTDGSWRHLESVAMARNAEAGPQARRVVGVVRDVSGEVQRADLRHQRDAAQKIAAARMEFLSRLSHELRTPLNAILGFGQLLALEGEHVTGAAHAQRVQLILDAGHQLLQLVEDVLDLTKIDAGSISVNMAPVEVGALLRATVALLEGTQQKFSVSIVNRIGGQALWVMSDGQRLQQVLINLLTNACKYNHSGGRVEIDAEQRGDTLRLSFTDTGVGISAKDLAQLFQPFKRVAERAGQVEGTGLGLFIVKFLLERMNADIEARSEPGQGSVFTVVLPRAPAP